MPSLEFHQPSEAFIRALTESQAAIRGYCQASLGNADEAKEALQRTSIDYISYSRIEVSWQSMVLRRGDGGQIRPRMGHHET